MQKSGSEPSPGLNSSLNPPILFHRSLCIKWGAQWEPCKSLLKSSSQNLLNLASLKFSGEEPQSKFMRPLLADTLVPVK